MFGLLKLKTLFGNGLVVRMGSLVKSSGIFFYME